MTADTTFFCFISDFVRVSKTSNIYLLTLIQLIQQIMIAKIIAVFQGLAFISAIDGIAEQEVLKKKIHHLIDEHKDEIQTLGKIYELCEKLHFQQGLLDQLKNAQLYCAKQWAIIGRSMNQQIKFVNDFMNKQYKDIPTQSYAPRAEWTNGLTLAIYSLSFIRHAYQAYIGEEKPNPPSPELLSYKMREEFRAQSGEGNMVENQTMSSDGLSTERVIQNGSYSSDIINRARSQGVINQSITRQRFKTFNQWKNKPAGKFASQYGMRIILLAGALTSYIFARLDIKQLSAQFSAIQQFFGEQGGFIQKEGKVATTMLALSANIYTLASLSHSVISELHNISLVRSAVEPSNANYYFTRAKQMDPKIFGLTADFQKSCDQVVKRANIICRSTKDIAVKLDELHQVLEPFIKHGSVTQVFEKVTTTLSKYIGDILSKQLHQQQRNFISFLKEVSRQFTKKRGENFESKPLIEKKQIDSSILRQVEYCYKLYILDDDESALNSNDQKAIVETLSNFCIKFYATDDTGAKVYKYIIADNRSQKRYKDLLLDDVSEHNPQQGRVPIKLSDPILEKKEREKMVDLAHKVSKKGTLLPGDFSITTDDIEFRYTRVTIQQNGKKNDKGQILSSAIGSQGAQFTYQHRKYFVEKQLLKQQGIIMQVTKKIQV